MTRCWEPGTQYNYDDVVDYQGHRYKIIQPHRSQGDWTPPVTPALWGRLQDDHHHGGDNKYQQQGYQPQQPQQPYQQPQQHQPPPPQYGGQPGQQQQDNKPWYGDEDNKKKIGLAAGVLGGAAVLAGGMFAYKKHEEDKDEAKAQAWSRENWLNDARARTQAFHQQGPSAPATWLLTHGKSIPKGAILVGREKSWNLYISRAYYDGGLLIGKASDAFKKGGVVGCKNEEVHVEDYEVLAGDMSQLRWVASSGKLHLASLGARPVEGGREVDGTPIYVAKAPHKGAEHPGKVGENWDGAYIPYDGEEKLVKEYQVLCYNY
ncbi:hypothetical protein NLJ89_g1050 [Agrocybe chaxingu]|uniref:Chitin-binding type-3 domain-containing protein n=1 Tax=Agrocybe chaxingu TaxID=84603 RepID=A0A9W8TF13_9AGAR|nr:hypothetical protein NLJ89_g1050 [Agrocybe chaxingu]